MQTSRASLRLLVIASAVVFVTFIFTFRRYSSATSTSPSSIDFSAPFGRLLPQPPTYAPPDKNITNPYSTPVGTKPRHCIDPYREQGLFYFQNNSANGYQIQRNESRWIPYTDDFFNLEDPPQATWPSGEDPVFNENSTPPQDWLDRSPRNWMKDLVLYIRALRKQSESKKNEDNRNDAELQKREEEEWSHINWIRNKRVLLLGDSIMRMQSEYFCQDTGGQIGCTDPHQACWCTVPQLNFTIVMWHIPGMFIHHNATWWWMKNWKLVDFESRFEIQHKPTFPRLFGQSGRSPDLILFETGLWDERAFRELARSHQTGDDLPHTGLASPRRHITWEESRFFTARMKKFIPFMRQIFGRDVPMMYQSLTTHNISDGVDLAVFDLDRISRFLTKKFELEIFEWSKIIRAHGIFWKDKTHPDKSPVSWLWSNMMFNYLFRSLGGLEVDGRIERLPSKEFKGYGGWDECHSWNLLYN